MPGELVEVRPRRSGTDSWARSAAHASRSKIRSPHRSLDADVTPRPQPMAAGAPDRQPPVACVPWPAPVRPTTTLRPVALPSTGARVLAFAAILVAGVCGGLIGYAVIDLQCEGDCTTVAGHRRARRRRRVRGRRGHRVDPRPAGHGRMAGHPAPGGRCRRRTPLTVTAQGDRRRQVDAASVDVADLRDLATAVATEAGDLLLAALDDDRTVGRDQVDRHRHGHRDGPGQRGAASSTASSGPAPTTPSSARRAPIGAGTSGVRWVIDPLDGTTNYLYRLPGWNVSIGVEVDGARSRAPSPSRPTARSSRPPPASGATLQRRPPSAPGRPGVRCTRPWSGTGFSYEPDSAGAPGRSSWWT